jgi:hypothetical protein
MLSCPLNGEHELQVLDNKSPQENLDVRRAKEVRNTRYYKQGSRMFYTGMYIGRVVNARTGYLLHMTETCRHVLVIPVESR